MSNVCCVCNESRDRDVKLHSFPRDQILANKWRVKCNLQPGRDLNSLRVCSKHFKPSDYRAGSIGNGKLCWYAVPELEIPLTEQINFENQLIEHIKIEVSPDEISTTLPDDEGSFSTKPDPNGWLDAVPEAENPLAQHIKGEVSPQEFLPLSDEECCSTNPGPILTQHIETEVSSEEVSHNEGESARLNDEIPCSSSTIKKPRIGKPRFISEISIEHVATPGGASNVLRLVKKTFERKRKIIKSLNNNVHYLRQRVTKLSDLIQHLRQKGLVTANMAETTKN